MLDRKVIKAVGFDLDESLYPSNAEINDRIRNSIAREIMKVKPELKELEQARAFFEGRYADIGSGSKVLIEAGYNPEEASRIADNSVSQAEIIDLIRPDPTTSRIIRRIGKKYFTYLITSSPKESAIKKLRAIGIKLTAFHLAIYGDTKEAGEKQNGDAFRYTIKNTDFPARSHVYVGNSLKSDILPARLVGMQTIAVWSNIKEASTSIKHIHDLERILL